MPEIIYANRSFLVSIVYMGILSFYILFAILLPAIVTNKETRIDNWLNDDAPTNQTASDILMFNVIKTLVSVATICFLIIFSFFYQDATIVRILSFSIIPAFLFSFVIYFSVIFRYLFTRPHDYELTKWREASLFFIGLINMIFLNFILNESRVIQLNRFLDCANPILKDSILMLLLVVVVFAYIFFSLALFLLTLQNANDFLRDLTKTKPQLEYKPLKLVSESRYEFLLSSIMLVRINGLSSSQFIKKLVFRLLWFISIPLDATIMFFAIFILPSVSIMGYVVKNTRIVVRNTSRYFSDILYENKGKAVILISRFSIIASLLTVLVIDKYYELFSPSGSSMYEFLCSVIIIPIFITQLIELKKLHYDESN